jgi:hypothetical protein
MVKTMLTGVAVAISLSACQHLAPLSPAQYAHAREHSVFIGQEGHALLPDTVSDAKALGVGDSLLYGRYIGGIMDAVRRSGKSEIMLRIHGGVNSLAEQVDTNISITKGIYADSPDSSADYYPLYVNWESSISRSYVDHLLFVRQGHAYRGVNPIGWGLAPLYVVADVGRALTAAPLHWKAQITSFWGTGAVNPTWLDNDSARSMSGERAGTGPTPRPCDRSPENAALRRADPSQVALELCPFRRTRSETWLDRAIVLLAPLPLLPTLPYPRHASGGKARWFSTRLPAHVPGTRLKLFSPWMADHVSLLRVPLAPLSVIAMDAIGKPSYENMRRRTETMFHDADEFALSSKRQQAGNRYAKPTGALPQFIDSLNALVQNSMPFRLHAADSLTLCWSKVSRDTTLVATSPYHVTLIAHSMGAIIAGDILRSCPGFAIGNVVFMAAAQTVREFDHDVLPYLGAHPDTRFYNLTLHPRADRLEATPAMRFFLHGSLLAWLDGSLNDPDTDGDRVIGRYETAMAALHLIPDSIRGRVYLKGFGYGGDQREFYAGGRPYQHAHFGEARVHFWRCDFWTPATALSDCIAPARRSTLTTALVSVP